MGIAWLGHVEKIGGVDEYFVDRPGMTREQLVAAFPAHWNSARYGMDFNRTELIKAIILEAYQEAQDGFEREPRNVRGFWYERLLYTLRTVMQDGGKQNSINCAINAAWGDLVESGTITYAGMSIRSAKSKEYHVAVRPDSPYPSSVVLVEKEDFFEPLRDIADTYEIAFVATGGQNSRCAAMEYVEQLRRTGVDLRQPFTVYSFCDFDPEGWRIPEIFIEHLCIKIAAPIRLVRLGILAEQISDSVLRYQATAYEPDAETDAAKKAAETKYRNFVEETGGIFMPDTGEPARIEIDMYKAAQIRERILEGLAERIDGFSYQVRAVKGWIVNEYESGDWEPEDPGDALDEVYDPYYEAIDERRSQIDEEAEARAPEARAALRELLQNYWAQRRPLDAEVAEATADLEKQKQILGLLENNLKALYDQEHALLLGMPNVESAEFRNPQEAFAHIEDNGGWREWMEQQQIEIVQPGALTEAAQRHGRYIWQPEWAERESIREWMADYLIAEVSYDDPDGPDQSPEEMIREALGE